MRHLAYFAIFSALLFAATQPAGACSITAAGSCGGSACDDGYSCRKVSDFECSCIKENEAIWLNTPQPQQDDDISATGNVSGILNQGDSAVIFAGVNPRAFTIRLQGSIRRTAQIKVSVDNRVVATLTHQIRSVVVEGSSIVINSAGAEPQGFSAIEAAR